MGFEEAAKQSCRRTVYLDLYLQIENLTSGKALASTS